jgi:Domain of unknown function (DUF6851)/VCPO second helical-bundle domain
MVSPEKFPRRLLRSKGKWQLGFFWARRRIFAAAATTTVALAAAATIAVRQATAPPQCPPPADHPEWSVARRWDEAMLDAIRRALPAPTVHARNLFHTSAAMWDAWAAYEPNATGYFLNEKHTTSDITAARNEAISYAAYRVLTSRFIKSVGADESLSEFDNVMDSLCYPLDNTTTSGDSPAAIGNRIAAAVIAYGLSDGSNQADGYTDPTYAPVNPPLVVAQSGTTMSDPNRWQPLQLEHMISQNGIPVVNGVQQFVGPHWGGVKGFALPSGGADRLPLDPGRPPQYGDSAYAQEALVVVRDSAALDTTDGTMLDISPANFGNNTLGTNDGHGRTVNPFTNQPYTPDPVNRGDFTRSLAEFWADGPNSETPPGHWNVIANNVSDQLAPDLRIAGTGGTVDRLQWDVKLYFALNGAVHDAAIAAWGAKGHYDSVRPISMIRYLGQQGVLPLADNLVQLDGNGQNMVRAWRPGAGVGWFPAAEWVPYQAPTFVTPAFAGYFSGHSTFSRAAAEVLTGFTGSEYFPGGVGEYVVKAGALKFEEGPSSDVPLRWATYFDAADQAGISRLYGGIHIPFDDFTGRIVGSECGKAAWTLAQRYFSGLL